MTKREKLARALWMGFRNVNHKDRWLFVRKDSSTKQYYKMADEILGMFGSSSKKKSKTQER